MKNRRGRLRGTDSCPPNQDNGQDTRKGLVAFSLKGRKSRPWAKPRVGKTKRSAAHASRIGGALKAARGGFRSKTPPAEGPRKARFFCGNPQKKCAQIPNCKWVSKQRLGLPYPLSTRRACPGTRFPDNFPGKPGIHRPRGKFRETCGRTAGLAGTFR
jgi:hypothetical protein